MKRYYFAPMEGITGPIYRKTHQTYFPGADKYFMPFCSPRQDHTFTRRELSGLLPEHNEGVPAVPQLLTRNAQDFLWAAGELAAMGYQEVNLNLGCPSGTVVSKGRGAGFLADLLALERFLDVIFEKSPCEISIKTRIGVEDVEEFPDILKLLNRYPVKELIIHPRTRREFYRGIPHRDAFLYACRHSGNPLCYNGDVTCREDLEWLEGSVMIGRGFLARPGFCGNARRKADDGDQAALKAFVGELLDRYREVMSGDIHALHKMKELWIYLAPHFTNYEKYLKKIKKTNKMGEYLVTVERLFGEQSLGSV